MTLHPQTNFAIPEETIRVARAAYPRGEVTMIQAHSAGGHAMAAARDLRGVTRNTAGDGLLHPGP